MKSDWGDRFEAPILNRLADDRVFSVLVHPAGFLIGEECDANFATVLEAHELERLASELLAIARKKRP